MAYQKLFNILKTASAVNASFNCDASVEDMNGFSIQAKWANQAALAGSIKLQCSNNATDWEDIASSSVTFSGNGTKMWIVTGTYFRFVRVVTTISGGSADFNINIFGRA